ncbi:NADH-quinone oxidoreductase subunit N [Segeticoccus rhizosphaerae]|uniref:NADH-quinone oxidoreductase subunit N n=1 Tax=Segeticoccus rhizosphaerae TaxID=1104777 RepID=UPI0010C05CA0|nr:NADH-quinone oxidoreductase subunit N [Ornithinicoccus soli]
MHENPAAFAPELVLLAGAVIALLTGSFVPRHRQWAAQLAAAAALAASLAATATAGVTGGSVYAGSYTLDSATFAARLIVPAAALLTLAVAAGRTRGDARESEFAVLVLLASAGTILLAGSSDLLLLAVAYLLASIPLYALAGWGRDRLGAEGALKTYLLGVLTGILLLLGVAILFGLAGSTSYADLTRQLPHAPAAALATGVVAVLAGLLFKAGAVPAHFWVPDAVQGATTGAGAFLTTVPKVGALLALYRLMLVIPDDVINWRLLLAIIAAASMTLGNLAAFTQDRPTRLLAYSTISQVGYLLMAIVVAGTPAQPAPLSALVLYLAAYAAANLGAFAVVATQPHRASLADYRGLARAHPALAGVLVVCLLALVGTPPTGVFTGKLTIFTATWDGGWAWLVVIAAINTVASLYYYLRWIAPAFTRPAARPEMTGERPEPRSVHPEGGAAPRSTLQVLLDTLARPAHWVTASALIAGVLGLLLGPAADVILTVGAGGALH